MVGTEPTTNETGVLLELGAPETSGGDGRRLATLKLADRLADAVAAQWERAAARPNAACVPQPHPVRWTSPSRRLGPGPVLFTLLSWNSHVEPVRDWLTGQLRQNYVGVFTGRAGGERIANLLDRGQIAVILDGLDEIDDELRPVVVAALDEQATTFRLVVLSRNAEWLPLRTTGCSGRPPLSSRVTCRPRLQRTTCDGHARTARPRPGKSCSASCEPSRRAH